MILHTRVLRVSSRYQLGFIAADLFLDFLGGLFPLLFMGMCWALNHLILKGFCLLGNLGIFLPG